MKFGQAPRTMIGTLVALVTLSAQVSCGPGQQSTPTDRSSALEIAREGDCNKAIPLLKQVVAADPAGLVSRQARATCYLKQHRLTEAIQDYQAISNANPSAGAFLDLAKAQWSAGQTEAARATLQQAARAATGEQTALLIAETQNAYGDAAHGRTTLMSVPESFRDFRWFIQLGKIDAQEVDRTSFERDFSAAVRLAPAPSKGEALVALGDARWIRGEYDTALDAYQRASASSVKSVHLYSQIADCLVHLGRLSDAVTNYQAALGSAPNEDFRETLTLDLAQALIQLHRNDEAIVLLRKLLSNSGLSADTVNQAKALQALAAS